MSTPTRKPKRVLTWIVCVLLMFAASCERDDVECPSNATVEIARQELGNMTLTRRTCRWDDRVTLIDTDTAGEVISRKSLVGGQLDGLQIEANLLDDMRTESNYRRGLLHGHQRRFIGTELVGDCSYFEGARDGTCWNDNFRFGTNVEHYDRGKRTGVWSYELGINNRINTKIYGDDILLAYDGHVVPLPPPSIEVYGEIISRARCPRTSGWDTCRRLFDSYQICELDMKSPSMCKQQVADRYRRERERRNQIEGRPAEEL